MQCPFHSVSVIVRILQFYNHRPVSTTNLLQLIMISDVNNLYAFFGLSISHVKISFTLDVSHINAKKGSQVSFRDGDKIQHYSSIMQNIDMNLTG